MKEYTKEECELLLKNFGIKNIAEVKMIDSSHGAEDIRHNYVIDGRYVLRINSAQIFTDQRMKELNTLIEKYRDFGLKVPLFMADQDGVFVHEADQMYYYVSEYVDGIIPPEELTQEQEDILVKNRLALIASFATKYKNMDISETMSMYSLFDLSPYDLLVGIDEKQDNLNELVNALEKCGEHDLAMLIVEKNKQVREKLLSIYKQLPRCVFQGDENWGNLIVNQDYEIIGLFDFNMAGTEVIMNYFANNAMLIPCFIVKEDYVRNHTAKEVYDATLEVFDKNTKILKQYYDFSEEEEKAYALYAKIVMMSSYPKSSAYIYYLENDELRKKACELLYMILEN